MFRTIVGNTAGPAATITHMTRAFDDRPGRLRHNQHVLTARLPLLALLTLLTACPRSPAEGEAEGGSETDGDMESTTIGEGTGESTGQTVSGTGVEEGCTVEAPGGLEPEALQIPADCEEPEIDNCKKDQDRDGLALSCDNAEGAPNPGQSDIDGDGIGDVVDLCPLVGGDPNNTSDTDRDGVGDSCDNCRGRLSIYNAVLEAAGVPFSMRIRNNPFQGDIDADGIGDACDNCPTVPNCGGFGPDNPARFDSEIPWEDPIACQADADGDGIGDACQDVAGMGFSDEDDLDGDGLPNAVDGCPRIPVDLTACADSDAPCEHADDDGDGIGNACDTCPGVANPEQRIEGSDDDLDGDFVGAACEPDAGCADRSNPRPIGFFDVHADGYCCVRTYPGDGAWRTPDGLPIRLDCEDGDTDCAPPAPWVQTTPGAVELSAACEVALEQACQEEASPVRLEDVDGDLDRLWSFACLLPQRDSDLDGIGNACDLCPFDHDPTNASFVDHTGREWPNDGAYCNGEYLASNGDPADGCWIQ